MSETLDDLEQFREDLVAVANLLRQNIERLTQDMNSGLAGSKGAGSNEKHVRAIKDLSLASTNLGKELRQWQKRKTDKAKTLSKKEKMDIIVRFAEGMNPPERKKLISVLLDMP